MTRINGGIIGGDNTPNFAVASGMWSTSEITKYVRQSFWPPTYSIPIPNLFLDFQSTTTLDSRISFTRATNGTYFNSSGVLTTAGSGVARFDHRLENGSWVNKGLLIEEQRSNLCKYSEELNITTTGNWQLFNASVAANATTAPNGVASADKLVENTSTAEHFVFGPNITYTSGTRYVFSVFLKSDGRSIRMLLPSAAFTENKLVWFNLSNGTVTNIQGSGITTSIQDCGNGWYRCSMSAIATASPTNTTVTQLVLVSTGTTTDYTGNGSSGVFIWGAQMEAGSFPTSYIATSASSVTRNADVASMTGTNFSSWYNATEGTVFWQGDLIGLGKAVSGAAAARGWAITDGTANERHFLNAESQSSGETLTTTGAYSVIDGNTTQANFYSPSTPDNAVANFTYKYASAYKVNDFALSLNGNPVTTDTTGTIPTVNRLELGHELQVNTLVLCGHIANFSYWPARLTNGQLQYISQNGYINQNLALVLNFDQTTILDPRITFTRATNGTYFNSSGVLTTAGSGVARFDHRLESGVWVNKGLLIEEQRTNLVLRSEEFNDSYWTKDNLTVTTDNTTAPDGLNSAERLRETTASGVAHIVSRNISENLTSTPYTFSAFIKSDGRTKGTIQLTRTVSPFDSATGQFDLAAETIVGFSNNAGVVLDAAIQKLSNGWYRISVSGYTGHSTSNQIRIVIYSDTGQFSYTGDSAKGIFLWGAQFEAGAFFTSYIKTTTASVTRNADQASMTSTNFSSWYNQTEGTIFNQIGNNSNPNGANEFNTLFHYAISNNTNDERLQSSSAHFEGNNQIGFGVFDNSIAQLGTNLFQPISFSRLQDYRGAFAYKLNDFASSVNGLNVLTDNSGSLPTVDRIYFGANPEGTAFFLNGCLSKFYYWNTRKPDNFLIGVTK